jgi:hypothetical protein
MSVVDRDGVSLRSKRVRAARTLRRRAVRYRSRRVKLPANASPRQCTVHTSARRKRIEMTESVSHLETDHVGAIATLSNELQVPVHEIGEIDRKQFDRGQVLQAVGSCCGANVVPPGIAPEAIAPGGGAANPHCHRTSSLLSVYGTRVSTAPLIV